MRRWLPTSLVAQLVALLLLALVVSQGIALAVFEAERQSTIGFVSRAHMLDRTASVVRLLAETPDDLHGQILKAASGPRLRFWISPESAVPTAATGDPALAQALQGTLGDAVFEVRVLRGNARAWGGHDHDDIDDDDAFEAGDRHARGKRGEWRGHHGHHGRPRLRWLTMSAQLRTGPWLNATTTKPNDPVTWAWPSIVSMLLMALAITAIVVLVIRRLTRPLRQLSEAADRLGTGAAVAPLAVAGPPEIRQTTMAFNRMNDRLHRFVQDRTRMLAAISHDLRTPITSLRLRAELIDDAETRDKMLKSLDEMQEMTEAAIAFAREEAAQEDTRTVDLTALVEALVEDMTALGHDVQFEGSEKLLCACRTLAVKRTVRNLIENAISYGERARVQISQEGEMAVIRIDDDGPGIPDEQLEQVFKPFLRLETSRGRATGGVGLGLAIARSIARSHGGDIVLSNRAEGGLSALLSLPLTL